MSSQNFFLEISKYKNKNKIWSKFEKKFVYLKYTKKNLDISFHSFIDSKLCIIGMPILGKNIDNDSFARLFIKNKNKKDWINKKDEKKRVHESRGNVVINEPDQSKNFETIFNITCIVTFFFRFAIRI